MNEETSIFGLRIVSNDGVPKGDVLAVSPSRARLDEIHFVAVVGGAIRQGKVKVLPVRFEMPQGLAEPSVRFRVDLGMRDDGKDSA